MQLGLNACSGSTYAGEEGGGECLDTKRYINRKIISIIYMSYVTLVYSVSVNANNSLSISEYFFETSKTHVPYADEHSRRFVK